MLSTLSDEAMRLRFFSPIKATHELLVKFCNIDYDREMAIVAETRPPQERAIVAIGRLIVEADEHSAEFAILVRDDYHGKGVGYKLTDMLIGIAQEKGLDELHGTVLTQNRTMLRLAQKLGFATHMLPDGITTISLRLR